MADKKNIFWFRRDLRLDDNVGFLEALKSDHPVMPVFIFDRNILDDLEKDDSRVTFIYDAVQRMRDTLQKEHDTSLAIFYGKPVDVFEELVQDWDISAVFTNRDYEPYAKERDERISKLLEEHDIDFKTFKDQVIFERDEVVKGDGGPYKVYTPYKNKWMDRFRESIGSGDDIKIHYTSQYMDNLYKNKRLPNQSLSDMGFERSNIQPPDYDVTPSLLDDYAEARDYPAEKGTSRIGPYLRHGLVSIRKIVRKADKPKDKTYLEELVWREFYMQILDHYPRTTDEEFKKKYESVEWRNDEDDFQKWCEGKTGYPLVDAGMRQLVKTGYMHNRIRMLTASFLCKHLLIDWRWGEAFFAKHLLDYEQCNNVGGWQWAAGCGVDAQPYFRIFNPITHVDKYDEDHKYIKKFVPEYGTDDYPDRMVEHKAARERALETYKAAVKND